jgi:hypothetical protein
MRNAEYAGTFRTSLMACFTLKDKQQSNMVVSF